MAFIHFGGVRRFLAGLAAVVAVAVVPLPASAVTLTSTNLDTLTIGAQVGGSVTSTIMTADLTSQGGSAPTKIGTLIGEVYLNASGIYTYVLDVTPTVTSPKQFSTQFDVTGFDPSVMKVGWSYSDAVARGAVGNPGTAFNIGWSQHNGNAWILDFTMTTTQLVSGFWSGSKVASLTFFFQSTSAPGLAPYNLSALSVGSSANWAPDITGAASGPAPLATPEPTTFMLLGPGVAGALYWLRRRV